MSRPQFLFAVLALCVLGLIVYFFLPEEEAHILEVPPQDVVEVKQEEVVWMASSTIGRSVEDRALDLYSFGTGTKHVLFVGGIHGGYEWNSVLLAYTYIDHVLKNPSSIPSDMRVSIIPVLNPDGLFMVSGGEGRVGLPQAVRTDVPAGTGRFNANAVDLNRNFDCKWQSESMWRSKKVSAGTAPFSEPEAQVLRDFVLKEKPDAVVFWHSKANAVYASECTEGILPMTRTIMNAYAQASGYKAVDSFDAYPVSGDAEGWLASIGIPAITVELSTYTDIEWERNEKGIDALLRALHAP